MATKATKTTKNAVVKNTPKKGSKSVTSKKEEVVTKSKTNIFKNIWNFSNNNSYYNLHIIIFKNIT